MLPNEPKRRLDYREDRWRPRLCRLAQRQMPGLYTNEVNAGNRSRQLVEVGERPLTSGAEAIKRNKESWSCRLPRPYGRTFGLVPQDECTVGNGDPKGAMTLGQAFRQRCELAQGVNLSLGLRERNRQLGKGNPLSTAKNETEPDGSDEEPPHGSSPRRRATAAGALSRNATMAPPSTPATRPKRRPSALRGTTKRSTRLPPRTTFHHISRAWLA